MKTELRLRFLTFVCLFLSTPTFLLAQEEPNASQPIRAMSFNIRLGVAKDGDNHWDKRKDLVIETIKNFEPDFVGTQETWNFQAKYLGEQLTDYHYVGRSRQDDDQGEQCGILFRKKRFDKLTEGHFWLSETPERPGSKSWDSSLPRMATWLKLWDRQNEHALYVVNSHFDHRGSVARTESAKLIRKFVSGLPPESFVVITGDFNASVDSDPYQALFFDLENNPSPVVDSYLIKNAQASESDGTFNGFKGKQNGPRIDWIAVSRSCEVIAAEIDRSDFDGRFPSDHFPVTAEIRFK